MGVTSRGIEGTVATVCAGLAGLVFAGAADADTTALGQLAPPGLTSGCNNCTDLQNATSVSSPAYTVPPGNWTIFRWQVEGGTSDGAVRLRVFRPTGTTDQFTVLSESTEVTVPAGAEPVSTTALPVQGGDVIGIRTGAAGVPLIFDGVAGDIAETALGDPSVGQTLGPTGSDFSYLTYEPFLVNIQAELYRSPPDTFLQHEPPAETHSRNARFNFNSDVPTGATFECKIDDRRYRPCSSPKAYHDLDTGVHHFRVRAIDGSLAPDPTPARSHWRITH